MRDPRDPGTRELTGIPRHSPARARQATKASTPTHMRIGYARVSTADQNQALQTDALKVAGCQRVYADTASGKTADRPQLAICLQTLRAGDELVVWRLDRLGRSLRDLIAIVEDLHQRGIAFRSLTEAIDTRSAGGRLTFQVFGALAEFERALIRERTVAGLAAARARGRKGGRRPKLNTKDVREMRALYKEGSTPIADIAKRFGIGRSTVYRSLAKSTSQKAR